VIWEKRRTNLWGFEAWHDVDWRFYYFVRLSNAKLSTRSNPGLQHLLKQHHVGETWMKIYFPEQPFFPSLIIHNLMFSVTAPLQILNVIANFQDLLVP
jgi:hypothetical protein